MKHFIVTVLMLATTHGSPAQEFELDTLLYNGSIEKRINYVFLGDGYVETQLIDFKLDAKKVVADLFEASPFKEYANFFNVFCISVPSNEEGVANDPQNLIDNYFGSSFNFRGEERRVVLVRQDRLTEVLANTFPSYDEVIMLINTSRYGGVGGGELAVATTHELASEIVLHELGHSFAGLADEYWPGVQSAWETHNMTREMSPTLNKWKNWLGDEGINIYPHSEDGWYKPHENCAMQFVDSPFCAVCREQFIRAIHELIPIIDDYSPKILDRTADVLAFNVNLIIPQPNTLKVSWFLNGTAIGSKENSIEINQADLIAGNNEVTVQVYDSTSYDRKVTIHMNSVTWEVNNGVTSSLDVREENREGNLVTSVHSSSMEKLDLTIYPNPTSDRLKLEYELQNSSIVRLSIVGVKGQLIETINHKTLEKNQYEIDLAHYDPGVYFLKFETDSFKKTFRFIKEN